MITTEYRIKGSTELTIAVVADLHDSLLILVTRFFYLIIQNTMKL